MKYDITAHGGKTQDLHIRLSADERGIIKRLAGRGTISSAVLKSIRLYGKWKKMVDRAEKYSRRIP